MSPGLALIIVIAIVAAMIGLVVLVTVYLSHQAGVRRKEYQRMRVERDLARKALHDVEVKADEYRDIDSALAASVRSIIRTMRVYERKISR